MDNKKKRQEKNVEGYCYSRKKNNAGPKNKKNNTKGNQDS